jgi:type IX secretion system PorP/SprF family membrane protein
MRIAAKISTLIMIWLCSQSSTFAQQQYVLTQYMFNNLVLNPAYAGSHETWSLTAMTRYQWVGIEGAPRTQTFTAHGPISADKNSSVGLMVINDTYGAIQLNNFYGAYSYRVSFSSDRHLTLGVQGGASTFNVDLSNANLIDEDDPALNGDNMKSVLPNFGTGVYYHGRKFHAGFSIPYMHNNRLNQLESDLSRQKRHYYFMAGSDLELGPNLVYKPSFLVRYVSGVSPVVDLNSSVLVNDIIWLGLTYRIQNSFDFIFEIQFTDKLRFGYSYDHLSSELNQVTTGSHELVLNYRIKKNSGKVYHPRRFR